MVDRYGAKNLVLWKKDLASAFNLMDFDASSAILLAFELTEGMTAVHTTGMFGWTGTPYAFQVITRVMVDLCWKHLEGVLVERHGQGRRSRKRVTRLQHDRGRQDGVRSSARLD